MMTKEKSQFIALGVGMDILTPKEGNDINSMLSGTHMLVATRTSLGKSNESLADMAAEAIDSARKSGFKFSKSSLKELEGVKVELVQVVRRALELSTQDFTVFDGIRTLKEQQQHVANGTSKTMQSKHLEGLAVDLVPWIGGKLVWDWEGCYKIAMAMDEAATQLGIANKIRWGGAWDRTLADFGSLDSWTAYESEVRAYHVRTGKSFVDGSHFEWVG